ncbi:MAG: ATP-binding cassette domain-containing protein, partial [Thermoleophilia bacterium]|nr:ATP-binding cassette domain-containing protein [Thermoleophilia bacterium]
LKPTSGTATIGGFDIRTQMGEAKKLNGLVPQELALYPTLSARANLTFFGGVYGLSGRALKERVDDVLHIVALTDRADEPVETYSGGMKRRVNIAAGLVHRPRLLFLDEPTVGVDPQSRHHIFDSVLRLNRERGMSIIYTTHYMEEVELLCSRAAIIDMGKIVAIGGVKEMIGVLGEGVIYLTLGRADDAICTELAGLPAVSGASLVAQPLAAPPAPGEEPAAAKPAAGQQVKIEIEDSRTALAGIFNYLQTRNVQVVSVEILEPNLESVFLHLTGKKLRE